MPKKDEYYKSTFTPLLSLFFVHDSTPRLQDKRINSEVIQVKFENTKWEAKSKYRSSRNSVRVSFCSVATCNVN